MEIKYQNNTIMILKYPNYNIKKNVAIIQTYTITILN